MSDRVSMTVLLCEDDPQEQLVRSYLTRCGQSTQPPMFRTRNASREVHGGNVDRVINEFPKELLACRRRHSVRANTRLIVVADADNHSPAQRKQHFQKDSQGNEQMLGGDPVMLLIPKRHVEAWIRAALGTMVNEDGDYKNPEPTRSEIRQAADQIYEWARDNAEPGPTCPESLRAALPEWRKIC